MAAAATTTETATVPVFLLLQDIQNSLMTPKPPVTPTPLVSLTPPPIPAQLPPPTTAPTTHDQAQSEPSIPAPQPSRPATSSPTTDLIQTHQSPPRLPPPPPPPPPTVPPQQHRQPSQRPKLTLNTTCPPPLPPPPRPPPPPSLPLIHSLEEEACLKTDTPTYQNTLLNAGMKGRNAAQGGGSVPELILPSQPGPAGDERGDAKQNPELADVGATIAGPSELPSLGLLQVPPPPYANTQTQTQAQAQQGIDTTRVRFRSPLEEVIDRDSNLPLNHGHESFSGGKDDENEIGSTPGTGYNIRRKIPARQPVAAANPDATMKCTGAVVSASTGTSGGATAAASTGPGTERTKPKSVGLRRKPVPRLGLGIDAKAKPLGMGMGRRNSPRSLRERDVGRERLNQAGRERERERESKGQGQGGRRRRGQVRRVDGWVVVGA